MNLWGHICHEKYPHKIIQLFEIPFVDPSYHQRACEKFEKMLTQMNAYSYNKGYMYFPVTFWREYTWITLYNVPLGMN